MNVLLIFSDQHNPSFTGCYGSPHARTRHIDRLAAQGTKFTAAYTPSPMCVPARGAMFAGQYAHKVGCWDNTLPYDGTVRGYSHHLQDSGVNLTTIGKLDFAGQEGNYGINEMLLAKNRSSLDAVGFFRDPPLVRRPVYHVFGNWEVYPRKNQMRKENEVTQTAIDWLINHKDDATPWVLNVNFMRPHSPWKPQVDSFEYYKSVLKDYDLPPKYSQPLDQLHPADQQHSIYSCGFDHDIDRVKNSHAGYLATIEELDDSIGDILNTLDVLGLAEDTVVIYTSDHGEMCRAHGIWEKSNMYEDSIRVPMIIRDPRSPAAQTVEKPVSLIDVFPTISDYLGKGAMPEAQGQSLRPFVENGENAAADNFRDYNFSESHCIGRITGTFALRKGDWKLIENVGYAPMLFNLAADPDEMNDLAPQAAADPAIAAKIEELQGILSGVCDINATDKAARAAQQEQKTALEQSGQLAEELAKRGFTTDGQRLFPIDFANFVDKENG